MNDLNHPKPEQSSLENRINPLYLLQLELSFMTNLLYIVAVVVIIGWLLGFFFFNAGNLIHILLVIAVIAILIRIIGGKRVL